jgi:hypothetical protein
VIDDCYELALPLRQRNPMMGHNGPPDTDRLFDSTAVSAVQGLASQTLDDVWPADQTPFMLKAGKRVPEEKREEMNRRLASVSEDVIEVINNSNFRSAGHECFLDYCIGTGIMLIEAGDALRPVNFRSIPLTECVLDTGPRGEVDCLMMEREIRLGDIRKLWPKARLSADMAQREDTDPDQKVRILEAMERDWSKRNVEAWVHWIIWSENTNSGVLIQERDEGVGSCPFVAVSFTRVSGEAMGRGPVMMALPDIRVANKLVELNLEHADLTLSGIWLYDDDGVINPDTAILEPGALIPKMPGTSQGLQNIGPSGNFQVGQVTLQELRSAIKDHLYVNDLGDVNRSPKTAQEISQRTADRARRLSGSYGRLQTEFLFPVVSRVWWLLKKAEGQSGLPPIDGDQIKVKPLGPLTRAQAQDDILRHVNYIQTLNQLWGPQAALMLTDPTLVSKYLADKMGFDAQLLRPEAEQQQMLQMAQQAMQAQQQPAPAAPAAAPAA